jgi:hypothetical protein
MDKGNSNLNPDFYINSGFLSYENRYCTLTAQYYKAKGNASGNYTDSLGKASFNQGYSLFGDYTIPNTRFSIFGRYDIFDSQKMPFPDNQRYILGLGYHFYKNNKLVIDMDYLDMKTNDAFDRRIYEAMIEIHF